MERAYENRVTAVSPPQPTLNTSYTVDGSRVLFIADTRSRDFRVDFVAEDGAPWSRGGRSAFEGEYVNTEKSGSAQVFYENDLDWMGSYPGRPVGTEWSRSFRHEDDSTRIISQYEDGTYDGLKPGEVTAKVVLHDYSGYGEDVSFTSDETTVFDVSGAPVKENATYGDLKFEHTPGAREVTPSFVFANPANHGLTIDVRLTATVGGETVADDTITTTLTGTIDGRGTNRNRVDAPTFRLPTEAVIQGQQVEYTIAPQVDYIDNATGAYRPPPATEWVSLACSTNPEEVTLGETFNVGATWRCDDGATVDVPISYTVSAGGATNDGTATVPAGLNEQLDISPTFAPTEEGELQATIRWDVQ